MRRLIFHTPATCCNPPSGKRGQTNQRLNKNSSAKKEIVAVMMDNSKASGAPIRVIGLENESESRHNCNPNGRAHKINEKRAVLQPPQVDMGPLYTIICCSPISCRPNICDKIGGF